MEYALVPRRSTLELIALAKETLAPEVYVDTQSFVCSLPKCNVVDENGKILSFDGHHLTNAGAEMFWGGLISNASFSKHWNSLIDNSVEKKGM